MVGFGLVAFAFLLVGAFASLLSGEATMLRGARKRVSRVRFEKVILHVLQMREKRGQALVGNGRVGGVVGGKAHPDGGEARYRL